MFSENKNLTKWTRSRRRCKLWSLRRTTQWTAPSSASSRPGMPTSGPRRLKRRLGPCRRRSRPSRTTWTRHRSSWCRSSRHWRRRTRHSKTWVLTHSWILNEWKGPVKIMSSVFYYNSYLSVYCTIYCLKKYLNLILSYTKLRSSTDLYVNECPGTKRTAIKFFLHRVHQRYWYSILWRGTVHRQVLLVTGYSLMYMIYYI